MKHFIYKHLFLLIITLAFSTFISGQNSVLVNFGSTTCRNDSAPAFSLIKNPLTASPSVLASCDLTSTQLPSIYNVFIAYNPRNNKVYVADIRDNITKIWIHDIGLPGSIACPASIPVAPTYSYTYVSNNFEFDNNGDLWSLSNYDVNTGQCNMDKFDVTTGNVINTRVLQFPAGHFPTTISSGDLTITPNGRMFAALGYGICQLYEITDYSSINSNASAAYLQTLPKDCYGIAYLNGGLELTGFDATSCYYYNYTISSNILSPAMNSQNGQSPVDNTSLTPALGTTKHIISTTYINSSTAYIVYEIYVRNMGNVILNNINLTDDLGKAFGGANISNVTASFTANDAGLTLNPAYNGTTVTTLLNPDQQLPNQTATNTDYFFKVQITCRVSNINPGTIYYNSAIGTATINNSVDPINVSDSSNNGTSDVVDPNNDGNASGVDENIPTPFSIGLLPVRFINVNATLQDNASTIIKWTVATPAVNASNFEPQFSTDGVNWTTISKINISNPHQGNYQYQHTNIPDGNLYYRIKQTDIDGNFFYSRVVLLQRNPSSIKYRVFPNPGDHYISISAPANATGKTIISLYDAVGRSLITTTMNGASSQINTGELPIGTYMLKITNNNQTTTEKILIRH